MFCDATGATKAHVFAKSYTSLFDDPNDTREHEVVHDYTTQQWQEARAEARVGPAFRQRDGCWIGGNEPRGTRQGGAPRPLREDR